MRIGSFEFRPGLWPTLATLILLPFLIRLGVWQLDRADWKQELVDNHADRASQPLIPVSELSAPREDLQYRQVVIRGYYDLSHQLLLDNRTHQGHAGYHVLTPLQAVGNSGVVLVNRGWVPVGPDRAVLPVLPGSAGEVALTATIMLPPARTFRLDTVDEIDRGWPRVVQQIEMQQLEQRLGHALLPVVLLLDKDEPDGFVRDWKPVYGVGPDKHRAYALQWFTLALVLLLIYIGVNTERIPNKS